MKTTITITEYDRENPIQTLEDAYRNYFKENQIGHLTFFQLRKEKKMLKAFKVSADLLLRLKWNTQDTRVTYNRDRIYFRNICVKNT